MRHKKIYFHYKFCGIDSYKISSSCLAVIISVVPKIQLGKKINFPEMLANKFNKLIKNGRRMKKNLVFVPREINETDKDGNNNN
jgi:hypothetical protein